MKAKTAEIQRLKNVPLTEQARAEILDAIMSKRFDTRLPSEEVLAEMLNVSRTTIRTALQSLEQDGIISRKRAIGTTINAHVRPSALALQRMVGFDSMLREKGYEVEVEVDWQRKKLSKSEAEEFGLEPGLDCMVTRKAYYADGVLAISIRDALEWSNLKDPDFDAELPPSIFEFSSIAWREPIDHVVVEMIPLTKKSAMTTALSIPQGRPFLRLHERLYAKDGDLLAISLVDVDTNFVRIEVFRRR